MKKFVFENVVKPMVEALVSCVCIVAILAMLYHFCYHIDGCNYKLGDNYATIEESVTDFFGNEIASWERTVKKNPGDFVIYEKWF